MPMTTKLGKIVTCLNRSLPIKSHDPFITWFLQDHVTN